MDDIMTAKDVAAYLKVNERTVLKYASEHKLPAVKVGGQWRFKREVLDRWLEGQMETDALPAPAPAEEPVSVSDWLRADMVLTDVDAACGEEVLERIVAACTGSGQIADGKSLLGALLRREQLCSTALGQGVAFPHGRSLAIPSLMAFFAHSKKGVDYGAIDGKPVHLFFMFIAPPVEKENRYLPALGQVVELIRDEAIREQLLSVKNFGDFRAIILGEN